MVLPVTVAAGAAEVATAATPRVVINELHYHPEDDNPASEFIELLNTTGTPISLSGWCVDGIRYCFPGGSAIAADGFVVVTGDRYDGSLSNGGEDITLLDAGGSEVDFLEYDDKEEWPAYADGDGASLQRRDPNSPTDHPGNWVAEAPTPGAANRGRGAGLLPTFSEVEHTVLPAPGAPIEISAEVEGAAGAEVLFVIGFGPQQQMFMTNLGGGKVTATLPGQPAGTLVRYRLRAITGGRVGTWPRQGDGAVYSGTTVRRTVDTELPVFEFFMPDDQYEVMEADLTLGGDDGYPMVFAYDGQIFDQARIRVKGQTSRTFPKKKFKIILPPGYDLEDDDLLEDDVDEWAMHSGWIDRSFLRETLSSEFMVAANARGAQQAFPVRFERNGEFFGLYTYVEQPDGTYRDRYDYDDSEVYEVGPDRLFGLLSPRDPGRSQEALRARYDKETFEYLGDDALRNFIATVNALSGPAERDWIERHVDIPSVVNILAASMVIQNQDWGVKNYRLVFDEYGRVGIAQNDYDLTWGRRWSFTSGPFDTRVYDGGAFEHPGGPFFFTFFADPELSAMVRRRVRTLTEELLAPSIVNRRVDELAALVRPEAIADRAIWGTYGGTADPTREAERIVSSFVIPHHGRILGSLARAGRVAATSQPAIPNVAIESVEYDGVEHVVVRNRSGDTVDLSSFEIPELELEIPGGTVLLPGRAAIFVHDDVETTANRFGGFLVAGLFEESLLDAPDGIRLLNRLGVEVDAWDVMPPGQLSELSADADRSAFVSIVATQTASRGYLQVLGCDDEPGATANLNADGAGQTRSALALTRFDADGTVCLYNKSATHAVADLQGYLSDTVVDDVPDERLLDTRSGARPGSRSVVRIAGARPNSIGIVSLVATESTGRGYLAVADCDGSTPATANLNWSQARATVANLATVTFDAAGEACLYVRTSAHVIADLQGYLDPAGFDDVADVRSIDTRSGNRPGTRSTTTLTGRPNATALVSLVATETTGSGYLQVLDCDASPGSTANLNYDRAGITVNGLTTVRFDDAGEACVFARTATDIVADLQGYFADGAFDDVPDRRLLDTRTD